MTLRSPLTGAAWSLTLVAAWWTSTTLAAVAGADPTDLPRLLTTDPPRAAAALVAAASHLLVAYLALLTVASALAALSGRESAVRRVRALAVPALRPVLDAGAGWALALGAATLPLAPTVAPALVIGPAADPAPAPAPDATSPDGADDGPPVTMRRLPDVPDTLDPPSEVLRRLPDLDAPEDPATAPAPTEPPTTGPPTAATPDPSTSAEPAPPPEIGGPPAGDLAPSPPTPGPLGPHGPADGSGAEAGTDAGAHTDAHTDTHADAHTDAGPGPAETWTIEPGDHLWHVAEVTLTEHDGADPSPARILAYLGVLVDANRDTLVEPGNADLVLPGQVFVLPAVAAS